MSQVILLSEMSTSVIHSSFIHPVHITYAVAAAMTQSSAHIISVQSADRSAPWDDLAQVLEIVRSGLQNERYIVLTVDQGVSQAAQVWLSAVAVPCMPRDCRAAMSV